MEDVVRKWPQYLGADQTAGRALPGAHKTLKSGDVDRGAVADLHKGARGSHRDRMPAMQAPVDATELDLPLAFVGDEQHQGDE
jgi:hypothetical protein